MKTINKILLSLGIVGFILLTILNSNGNKLAEAIIAIIGFCILIFGFFAVFYLIWKD